MKLSKKTRAALRRRKLTKFRWSAFEPKQGRTYSLEGTGERIRIVAVARNPEGWDVAALVVDDPRRLMTRSGDGYEEDPGMLATFVDDLGIVQRNPRIMPSETEPEAVDAQTQAQFGLDAKEKIALKAARVDALHAETEQLRREVPEVGRELWQAQARLKVASANLRRGTLGMA